jgi:hypothetical protein
LRSQSEKVADVVEKEERILRKLAELTVQGKLEWSARNGRLYVARYKNSSFDFFALESNLIVDGHQIRYTPHGILRDLALFENLDSEIQISLNRGGKRREVSERLDEVLGKLEGQ